MDLIGGYGSGSESEPDSPFATVVKAPARPSAPSLLNSLPEPAQVSFFPIDSSSSARAAGARSASFAAKALVDAVDAPAPGPAMPPELLARKRNGGGNVSDIPLPEDTKLWSKIPVPQANAARKKVQVGLLHGLHPAAPAEM